MVVFLQLVLLAIYIYIYISLLLLMGQGGGGGQGEGFFCEVDDDAAVDGYKHFISIPEWYHFRTPFSQYFTKNYSGVFLPLAHTFELSTGHVSFSVSYDDTVMLV